MVSPGNPLRTAETLFGPNGHMPHAVYIRLLHMHFDKCRSGYPYICFREQHRITMCSASHIQQSRYISHLRSRNRGAMTLLHPARVMSQAKILASIFGEYRYRADSLSDLGVKKIASKEPSGTTGVQPVCGRQVRRGKWPIMILLEISQHAVVEVRFL